MAKIPEIVKLKIDTSEAMAKIKACQEAADKLLSTMREVTKEAGKQARHEM